MLFPENKKITKFDIRYNNRISKIMSKSRRVFSNEFKAKIVLEALKKKYL